MTGFLDVLSTAVRWLLRLVGGVFGGIWLIYLFVSAIVLSTLSLSAIQLRDQLNRDGQGEITFREVQDAQERYFNALTAESERIDQSISSLEEQLNLLRAKVDNLIEVLFDGYEGTVPDEFSSIRIEAFPDFEALRSNCTREQTNPAEYYCEISEQLESTISEYKEKYAELQNLYIGFGSDFLEEQENLRATQPLYKHFSNLEFFQGTHTFDLLMVPREILVLLLTMSMGLLGSLVTMTWSFVRKDSGFTVQRFAVLPIVGMTTAFIVLVFINAGQMTLTAGSSGELNPFALSFVGIISGLLSERAYARISDVGNNFFATAGAEMRWANHLQKAMEEGEVTTQELARHLGLPDEDVDRIVTEAGPATLDQQKLIAACLRRPLRDIFTDAPPATAEKSLRPVVVPNLVGLDEKEAEQSLSLAGLTVGEVTKRIDDQAAPGRVVLQSPEHGSTIARSSKVRFTVSTGQSASKSPPTDASELKA